jgi:hypothetical protein
MHSVSSRALTKAAASKKEACEAQHRAEYLSALNSASHTNRLQAQNQHLQQQLQLCQLQLQAKQQQLAHVQAQASTTTVAYPALVARVAACVNRLVATAYHEHLPVGERQELAVIAEELLRACGQD